MIAAFPAVSVRSRSVASKLLVVPSTVMASLPAAVSTVTAAPRTRLLATKPVPLESVTVPSRRSRPAELLASRPDASVIPAVSVEVPVLTRFSWPRLLVLPTRPVSVIAAFPAVSVRSRSVASKEFVVEPKVIALFVVASVVLAPRVTASL